MRAAQDSAPGSKSRNKTRSSTTASKVCRALRTCGNAATRAHSSHRARAHLLIHTRHTPRAASSRRANPSPESAAPQTQVVPAPSYLYSHLEEVSTTCRSRWDPIPILILLLLSAPPATAGGTDLLQVRF